MAPSAITEDYYMILGVEQTATPQLIVSSYKRLALKLHPDRNAKHNATETFQLLAQAYETLKDEGKRRDYDLIYPFITRGRPTSQNTRPPPTSTAQPEALSEVAQIAAIHKLKQERGERWRTNKNVFDSTIFQLQEIIRVLEKEIKILDRISAAEAAVEARRNSWGTWLLSPIYKMAEDSEEEKERKDRGRQERRVEKDMKERRLETRKVDLKKEVDAANLSDDRKISLLQARIWAREDQERRERERLERERMVKIWKQQQEQRERKEREAAEVLRKQQAERRAAEQKQQEEVFRKWKKQIEDESRKYQEQSTYPNRPKESTHRAYTSTCDHDGWWEKVQGRTACPECHDIWTYLLHCPSCDMKACPKCQSAIRPRKPRNATRTQRRVPPRVRTPSPNYWDDYD
ncbi:DnaJ-domain-containing protein [Pleomassaria siparia CBS 279.74]|uniref:DnaJ-domain-containing protein n=1 Tax=Pleomassaria siparia CBS 279.74 TaxID=1314801 RepID=A0A6G1JSU3_9PLEO|nr:DnaJ-domain-containing protein [Pleomassaria siparia CBS 279.74]